MLKPDTSNSTKIHRDEVKKDKILQKKKMEMIVTIDNVIVAIRSNPSIWTSSAFASLRNFTGEVNNNPEKYPPAIDQEKCNKGESNVKITPNFVSKIYDRSITSRTVMDYDPIIQILEMSTKYSTSKFATLNDNTQTVKHVTLHAVDGANNRVTLKMATQMNGKVGMLRNGSIIKIHHFNVLPFRYAGGEYYIIL